MVRAGNGSCRSAASADDVSFTSSGGAPSPEPARGYVLTNATLTQVKRKLGGGTASGDLGSLSFSTGILQARFPTSLQAKPHPCGRHSYHHAGSGSDGLPARLTSFTGDLCSWRHLGSFVLQSDGTHLYTLNTDVTGQDSAGNVTGTMTFVINIGPGIFPGTTSASRNADTVNLVAVPEPAELGRC